MKHFETILSRLRKEARWEGCMIPDTAKMFNEQLPKPSGIDNRFKYLGDDKPSIEEMENEYIAYSAEKEIDGIKEARNFAFARIEHFGYLNVLHYAELSDAQKTEIAEYRQKWKDAPETKVIPEKPEWMEE